MSETIGRHDGDVVGPEHPLDLGAGARAATPTRTAASDVEGLAFLLRHITALRDELAAAEPPVIVDTSGARAADPDTAASLTNLSHYLTVRRHDLRATQSLLAEYGLSSLGRSEGHVLATVEAVLRALQALAHMNGAPVAPASAPTAPRPAGVAPGVGESTRILAARAFAVLGPEPAGHPTRVMVTMPPEAALDPAWCDRAAAAGMGLARINTAHDDAEAWTEMVHNLHATSDRRCLDLRILVDLAGPKLRTSASSLTFLLAAGDHVRIMRDPSPGTGREPVATVGCNAPQALDECRPGHRVAFDDGKLAGVVVDTDPFAVTVLLDSAPPGGAELRRAKGINLPDTPHNLAALTPLDRAALRLLAPAVDAVSLSFVREAADVVGLRRELHALHRSDLPVIVKIETAQGFRNLPAIIAAGVASGPFGVMIARGDLAVEIGYERLAEVQEEILWLCESAHVPTIWATQVLNTMTKKGRPSRSEITDAAMASRAECVMLNKGPHIEDALGLLDGILRRMSGHQDKKRSLMRQLRAWGDVTEQPAAVPEVGGLIA